MVQISLLFLFLWMPAITFLSKFEKRMNVAVGIVSIFQNKDTNEIYYQMY